MKNVILSFILFFAFVLVSCNNEPITNSKEKTSPLKTLIDSAEIKIPKEEYDSNKTSSLWVYLDSAIAILDTTNKPDTIYLRHKTELKFSYKSGKYVSKNFPFGYIGSRSIEDILWFKVSLNNKTYWVKEKDIRYEPNEWVYGKKSDCIYSNNNYYIEFKSVCQQCECWLQDGAIYKKDEGVLINTLEVSKLNNAYWINNDTLLYSYHSGTYIYSTSLNEKMKISNLPYSLYTKELPYIYLLGDKNTYTDSSRIDFIKYNLKLKRIDSINLISNCRLFHLEEGKLTPEFKLEKSIKDTILSFDAICLDRRNEEFYKIYFNNLGVVTDSIKIDY